MSAVESCARPLVPEELVLVLVVLDLVAWTLHVSGCPGTRCDLPMAGESRYELGPATMLRSGRPDT